MINNRVGVINEEKGGFTLVELLVVIMIIGIVLGISIPAVVNLQKSQNARKFDYFETIVKEEQTYMWSNMAKVSMKQKIVLILSVTV